VVQTASECRFVVNLQVSWYSIFLPILYDKRQNTVGILCIILLKAGMAAENIDAIDRNNFSVPGNIQRRDKIQLMNKAWVADFCFRIIDFLLLPITFIRLFRKAMPLEDSVDRRKARLLINIFPVKVLMNSNGATKCISRFRRIATLQKLSAINNGVLSIGVDFVRLITWLSGSVEKPRFIAACAPFDPFVRPVTGSFENRRNLNNRMSGCIQFMALFSQRYFIIGRLSFLSTKELLLGFSFDIICSRCPETRQLLLKYSKIGSYSIFVGKKKNILSTLSNIRTLFWAWYEKNALELISKNDSEFAAQQLIYDRKRHQVGDASQEG
jgi:hypothetical protein